MSALVPPHPASPPLHTHDFDETFYVLEGELIFQVEEALVAKGEAAGSEGPPWALQPLPEVTVVGPPIAVSA